MKLSFYAFDADTTIPYGRVADYEEIKEHLDGDAYFTNVDGKWYLEFDFADGTIRILDINNLTLSRDLTSLKRDVARHLQMSDLPERDVPRNGVKIELNQLSTFREVIFYADPDKLKSETVYNDHYSKFGLMRDETEDYYTIETIDGQAPDWDATDMEHVDHRVNFDILNHKMN